MGPLAPLAEATFSHLLDTNKNAGAASPGGTYSVQVTVGTPVVMLSRLLDEVLEDVARREEYERWWAWRLRQHILMRRAPQPEYDILRGLDTVKRPRRPRRLQRDVGGDPVRFRDALQALWRIGAISSQQEDPPERWVPGVDLVITRKGKMLLGQFRQLHIAQHSSE